MVRPKRSASLSIAVNLPDETHLTSELPDETHLTSELSISNMTLLRRLGSGQFGAVFEARFADRDSSFAVKRVMNDPQFANREADTLKILRTHPHPHVTKSFCTLSGDKDGQSMEFFVFELMPLTLTNFLASFGRDRRLNFPSVIAYFYQLCTGLLHLHSLRICHRDLKPCNVLVDPAKAVVKICDFGTAKVLSPDHESTTYICSRFYRAPELILDNRSYSFAIDMWSLGCIFGEMFTCVPLFRGRDNIGQLSTQIRLLGTPTKEEFAALLPNEVDSTAVFGESADAKIRWPKLLRRPTASEKSDIDPTWVDATHAALDSLLCWNPGKRVIPAAFLELGEQLQSVLLPRSTDSSKPATPGTPGARMRHVADTAAELCHAAANNNIERLRNLACVPGLDQDKGDYDKRTALHLAASEGAFDAVVCLVEELGAKVSPVDRWGGTPLDDAVREGHTKVSEYLQGKGAVFGVNGNTSSRNLAETEKHLEMIVRLAAQLQGGESAIHPSGDRWETSKTPVGEIEKCLASLCRPSSGRLGHRSSTKATAESS